MLTLIPPTKDEKENGIIKSSYEEKEYKTVNLKSDKNG